MTTTELRRLYEAATPGRWAVASISPSLPPGDTSGTTMENLYMNQRDAAVPAKPADETSIEQQIQAKGLTAPRITPDHIDACILAEQYHVFPGTTVTICCLTLVSIGGNTGALLSGQLIWTVAGDEAGDAEPLLGRECGCLWAVEDGGQQDLLRDEAA